MLSKNTREALLKDLKNPFPIDKVKWRVGSTNADKTKGIALAYIDPREVQKRLDEVMGIDGWQDRLIATDNGFICELDLWLDDRWVTKSNSADLTKVSPIKGGGSDAFKRAASKWGIGRYLYYLKNEWVPIKPQGKSYVLAETPTLPKWAKPGAVSDWETIAEMEADVNSGEDSELFSEAIDIMDSILQSATIEDLDMRVEAMTPDQQLIMAQHIEMKRRSLLHEQNIHSDNS